MVQLWKTKTTAQGVKVLAKVSRHNNISLLVNTYYRPTVDEIARRL